MNMSLIKIKKLQSAYQKGYVTEHSYNELSFNLHLQIEQCPLGDSHIFNNIIHGNIELGCNLNINRF